MFHFYDSGWWGFGMHLFWVDLLDHSDRCFLLVADASVAKARASL
jgi:hypothetical protein